MLLLILYVATRMSITHVFRALKGVFRHDWLTYVLFSVIFFPGTLVHELAHYLTAIALLLKVHSIHLIPERKGAEIKLGKVIYEKADFLRGILVGVAPVVFGTALLFTYPILVRFPHQSAWVNILSVYIMFVISTTMFSSRQDLVDAAAIIPFIIVTAIAWIYFKPGIHTYLNPFVSTGLAQYLDRVNVILAATIGIHIVVIVVLKLLAKLLRRSG